MEASGLKNKGKGLVRIFPARQSLLVIKGADLKLRRLRNMLKPIINCPCCQTKLKHKKISGKYNLASERNSAAIPSLQAWGQGVSLVKEITKGL